MKFVFSLESIANNDSFAFYISRVQRHYVTICTCMLLDLGKYQPKHGNDLKQAGYVNATDHLFIIFIYY